jgi:hypothetical protein
MSWERSKYEAHCESCGQQGFCIRASDDWGRSSTTWIGFSNEEPDSNDVGRKRSSSRDMVARCACGKSKVVVGRCLGECDYAGILYPDKP